MFDNTQGRETSESEAMLRRNLRGFDRDSLKILHPVFRDALRLLTKRKLPDKRETLLLPLVRQGGEPSDAVSPARPVLSMVRGGPRVPQSGLERTM